MATSDLRFTYHQADSSELSPQHIVETPVPVLEQIGRMGQLVTDCITNSQPNIVNVTAAADAYQRLTEAMRGIEGSARAWKLVTLCVRDPDASNDFVQEWLPANEDIEPIIDMDLGYAELSDWEEFHGWAGSHLSTWNALPVNSTIRERIQRIVWDVYTENAGYIVDSGGADVATVDELWEVVRG